MDKDSLRHTELVVALDVKDWKAAHRAQQRQRTREQITPRVDFRRIGFGEIKSANGHGLLPACSPARSGAGRHRLGIPSSRGLCKSASPDAKLGRRIANVRWLSVDATTEVWAKWQEEARKNWDASPTPSHGSRWKCG